MTEMDLADFSDIPDPPLKIIYSGRVQGVGFRWTCQRIAQRHPVTGTVKNLSDGTVELSVDGDQQALRHFLAEIETKMAGNIQNRTMSQIGENVAFEGFLIIG